MIRISQPWIRGEERYAVISVLDSGNLVMGERVAELEEEWAKVCQTKYAIAVSSGTAALHLALLAHGIGQGDEVITSPFTFIATTNAIMLAGAKPVFVDIEAETFCIDPTKVPKVITPNTAAVMPVHLYGHIADGFGNLRQDIEFIEDACQAMGAKYRSDPPGRRGTACYSLYATKNVMSGEGGMITTNSAEIAERCKSLRSHGTHGHPGYNYRMTEIAAAIGLVQLKRLDEFTEKRRQNAAYYSANLDDRLCILPVQKDGYKHAWHQYTIRVSASLRDYYQERLKEAGIETKVYYPKLATHRKIDHYWPVARQMSSEVLSLPVHPGLSKQNLEYIVEKVNQALCLK